MSKSKFYEEIKNALIERQVEDTYNKGINVYFPTDKGIEYPFACDGFVDTKTDNNKVLKLIIEYKFNEMMSNSVARAKVLVQVVYYIKRFEQNGMVLPNVCMIGDKDECFVMHTNELLKYLDENVDWSVSPSNAAAANPDLVLKISKDEQINPFIFTIDNNFDFKVVADKIKDLADNVKRYVRVTEHNLSKIFDYFCKNVLKGKTKLSGHDLVEIFMGVIGNKMNYYQHPSNPNMLVCNGKNVNVNGKAFESFFSYFERNYTPQETMRLKSIADRLIIDTDRRNSGDFWTPTVFVDYAHDMISKSLGEDWKEKYVVWDNAWGTGNLTRDYKFGELYCSTLYQSELNIGAEYNPEATKFQFDFLNDEIAGRDSLLGVYDDKLPKGLKDALLENKPIVFFLNPPYGKATGAGGKLDVGISDTKVKCLMKDEKIEGSQLIKQFLWRIVDIKRKYNLTNCYIACFTNPSWMIKPQSKNFRALFFNHFNYKNGVMFCASEFSDVSSLWGITFNIWKTEECTEKNNFEHTLIKNENGEIVSFDTKTLYNFDGLNIKTTTQYINEKLYKKHKENIIYCKDIKTMTFENGEANVFDDYLCTHRNNANDVQQNQVCFVNNAIPQGPGYLQVTKLNLLESCVAKTIRSVISANWIIDEDMYNMNVEIPDTFKYDCLVHSIFDNYCCSIKLGNKQLKNEFFWMQKQTIEDLANTNGFTQTYNDARTSKDRYVYEKLQSIALSPEAQKVLDKANEIVINTFKYRELFDSEHPEYQIMNWDCGWYQIKALAKEYAKSDYEEFVKLFKALGSKIRPMVYTLGFLK